MSNTDRIVHEWWPLSIQRALTPTFWNLDIAGKNLGPETIRQAVDGITQGQRLDESAIDSVGYAWGWGLTVACPATCH